MVEAAELADYPLLYFRHPKERGDGIALQNMYRVNV